MKQTRPGEVTTICLLSYKNNFHVARASFRFPCAGPRIALCFSFCFFSLIFPRVFPLMLKPTLTSVVIMAVMPLSLRHTAERDEQNDACCAREPQPGSSACDGKLRPRTEPFGVVGRERRGHVRLSVRPVGAAPLAGGGGGGC